jgi:hypothetical protein
MFFAWYFLWNFHITHACYISHFFFKNTNSQIGESIIYCMLYVIM